ncbi:hypothetical protein PVAP13_1NG475219 [Panicum virgatum]|uniref:Uncharacterized protein n=1 Tax=Panicum virgatum TaxID=38727 RepID=A0A8T0XA62_PANVG|nr:hypothetical protein PVAP13_1NG475219 [Panicum virgatum]
MAQEGKRNIFAYSPIIIIIISVIEQSRRQVRQSFEKKINVPLERNYVHTQTRNCYGLGEVI